MANRLKFNSLNIALDFAEKHIDRQNFEGAVVVLHGAMKQLLAVLKHENLDHVKKPDLKLRTVKDGMMSIEQIKLISAKTIGVSVEEMESRKKTQNVSVARQAAIYFARKEGYKVEEIGYMFDRNHSNISYTFQKVEDLLECDPEISAKIKLVGDNINECKQ